MKKKIFLVILSVLIIAGLSACSTANKDVAGSTESTIATTLGEKSTTENTAEIETAKSESTTKKSDDSDTTTKPAEQKSAGQTTTKKVTATQKQTTAQRQTTTQKQTTTKIKTTTATTTKQNQLTKSDVDWVQSQSNSYIKSKGCTVNSNVDSFSGRISSKPYTNKSELLEKVKDSIDYEHQHCIDSGWDSVDMFCKVESRSDGSYFIYVMYG